MAHPWDRRESETAKAWRAFAHYRDAGPGRSIRATTEALYGDGGKAAKRRHVEAWSARHDWVARTEAYDAHLIEQRRRRREAALDKAADVLTEALVPSAELVADLVQNGASWDDPRMVSAMRQVCETVFDRIGLVKQTAPQKVEHSNDPEAPMPAPVIIQLPAKDGE